MSHAASYPAAMHATTGHVEVHPLTPERWPDLVQLFGDRGDPAWCWCSWQRVPQGEHGRSTRELSRERLRRSAAGDPPPGLVAYRDGRAVGWVSVAPRATFPGITGREADADEGVWSITCFVIAREARRTGLTSVLLRAAIEHARSHGARTLEGYPVEPVARVGSAQLWTGVRTTFEDAGFRERGRFDRWSAVPDATGPRPRAIGKPPGRPVMRLELR